MGWGTINLVTLFSSESDFLCTKIDPETHLKAVKTTIAVMREMSEVA